jgi:Zn-finger protein
VYNNLQELSDGASANVNIEVKANYRMERDESKADWSKHQDQKSIWTCQNCKIVPFAEGFLGINVTYFL